MKPNKAEQYQIAYNQIHIFGEKLGYTPPKNLKEWSLKQLEHLRDSLEHELNPPLRFMVAGEQQAPRLYKKAGKK